MKVLRTIVGGHLCVAAVCLICMAVYLRICGGITLAGFDLLATVLAGRPGPRARVLEEAER